MAAFDLKDSAATLQEKLLALSDAVKEHDPDLALKCLEQMRLLIESLHKNRNGKVTGAMEKGVASLFSRAQRERIANTIERRKSMDITAVAIPMIEEANGNGNGYAEG